MKKLVIATRVSDLALWQAYHVKARIEEKYPDIEVVLNKIVSNGDKVLDKPLALIGGKGHFTKELEDAMLASEAHMAVHSLKDVPTYIPDGLELVAVTQRQDQSDVFLSHKYKNLSDLPKGAVVGTTSLRRRMQLLCERPDLKVKDLRGNVNTRLRKLQEGQYDAIILAYIGLHRLDLLKDIPFKDKLSLDMMIPPMGQAALGIEIVCGDEKVREIAKSLNDEETYICTQIERDFISKIGAGCSAPVACNAVVENNKVIFRTMIGFSDGTKIMQEKLIVDLKESQNLGLEMAKKMIDNGAIQLLEDAQKHAFKDEMPQRL
ncbi:MAG: hydroxymethylbilane synthase [Sulfurimonas sp.]|uniref:hydroxymethylbilane synthase n=1 Tax=Sulfurimonas sp. TaxID=2022749 RepID=UPI0025CCE059|nr:hydroxymethylbilane synthase [Sulfurimonas sp.]MCK9491354.1 hydroxymethylbilane synthase [Sulfurimonas sp.]